MIFITVSQISTQTYCSFWGGGGGVLFIYLFVCLGNKKQTEYLPKKILYDSEGSTDRQC